jgi:hypothetical protein
MVVRLGSGPGSGAGSSSEQASELAGLSEALSEESLDLQPDLTLEGEGREEPPVAPSPSETV